MTKLISIIDDNVSLLKSLKLKFNISGYLVNTFSDPTIALNYHEKNPADFYIIDYKMPKINGVEFYNSLCLKLKKNERALARQFVLFEKNKFCMWYSYEKKVGSYKIGYAESKNGINWKRLDNNIKINTSSKYEINMREYPCIISVKNKKYILYNGDDYGKKGILLAELEK